MTVVREPAGVRRQATLLLWGAIAAGIVLRLVVFRGQGFPSDVGTFMAWATRVAEVGPGAFYAPGYFSDYPPGFLYVLWLVGALFDGEALRLVVKMLSLPADIAIALFLARLLRPVAGAMAGAVAGGIWMVQPGMIFAGPLWGQIDSWGTLPFVAALVAAGSGRWGLAGALAGVAGMIKPQFGLVAIVVAGGALIELIRTGRWRPLALVVGTGLLTAFAIAIPFRMTPVAYIDLVRSASETYPYTSLYAFNIWSIVGDFWKPDDRYVVMGGALLVLGTIGSVALLWKRRDVAAFLAAGALAAMAFYFLPTRAHERYLFPAFALLLPFVVLRPRLRIPYLVLSGAFLASLYFAFTRYPFTEVTSPPLLEATLFSRNGQIGLALVMLGSAAVIAWSIARGEARLRGVATTAAALDVAPRQSRWKLPEGLRLGRAPTRRDVAVALMFALAILATRGFRLDHPRDMYFDEVYHARTAMELLAQRDVYEWTHPHLAKGLMALGILAFGGDRVERTETPPADQMAFAVSNDGTRAYATATGIKLYQRGGEWRPRTQLGPDEQTLVQLDLYPPRGPVLALAFEETWLYALTEQHVVKFDVTSGAIHLARDRPPGELTAFTVQRGNAIIGFTDRVEVVDMTAEDGRIATVPIPVAALTVKPDSSEVYIADTTGTIHIVDTTTAQVTSTIVGGPPVTALAYARGPERLIGAELGQPTLVWYDTPRSDRSGTFGGSVSLENARTREVAGPVRALAMVPRSQFLYALTDSGVIPVEPHGMSPFAGIRAEGTMLGVDGAGDELLVAGEGATEVVPTGRHALAWRIPGVAAAALLAFFIVLLARRLFASPVAPVLAGTVVLLDGSMFAQARIGMNDIYVATFIVIGWYFVVAAHRPRRSALLDLVLAGAAFGLALASKWVAAYAIAGLGLATVVITALAWAQGRTGQAGPFDLLGGRPFGWLTRVGERIAGKGSASRPRAVLAATLAWVARVAPRSLLLLGCFAVVPIAIYLASYVRWFGGSMIPYGWNLIELQQQMYWYHSSLTSPHPAGSPWWSWPLVLKPVYWYLGSPGQGMTAVIYDAGNIVLYWAGLAAVAWAAVAAFRARSVVLAFLLFALLTQYIAWIPITRVLFFYHFFTALPFYLLILTAALVALWERRRAAFVATYLALAAGAFVFFYPFISGQPVAADQAGIFFVLPTWQYDCQFYPQFNCQLAAFRGDIPIVAALGRVAVALGSALLILAAMTVLFRDPQRERVRAWIDRLTPRRT